MKDYVYDWQMWRGMEFHILGAVMWKAWAPNETLCRGTESKWLADERMDLAGLCYCKSSVRYGGWPVLRILWTKQASLNRIRHSIWSQWSCLRSSVDVIGKCPTAIQCSESTVGCREADQCHNCLSTDPVWWHPRRQYNRRFMWQGGQDMHEG